MSIRNSGKDGFLSGSFGRRLRAVRRELGLGVGEMCVLLGVKRDSYYKYERGSRFPHHDIILSILYNLGVSFDYLMTGEGDMFLRRGPGEAHGCGMIRETPRSFGGCSRQVEEMLDCMRFSRGARLAVLTFFQEYRYEKADLIESEMRRAKGKAPEGAGGGKKG